MGKIYKISNDINDNLYIGQTVYSLQRRFTGHIYASITPHHKDGNDPIHRAIRKYGAEHFQIELIEECPNSKLNERERYWIAQYDSYYHGYNADLGGEGHLKYDYDSIIEYYLSHGNSLTDTCSYFGIYDQVVYTALQSNNIDYKNLKNTNPKKKYTKPILLVEENLIFKNITDIDYYLNKHAHGNIRRCLNGMTEKAYGYHWKEIEEDGDLAQLGYTLWTR